MASVTPFARRTNSSTSLAQFYQEHNSNFNSGQDDGQADLSFCNAFWGDNDAGYEVLMARLRATGRTMDDMKAFWKERASIEEDYAKRLSKLAKVPVGKDEMGDLRLALEALRAETEKQAAARSKLAMEIKRDIEGPTGEFVGRLGNLKKTYQGNIEKSYKNKSLQEGYVAKARERYEQDCLRINSFTANSSIVQGKELDKLQKQLEKVNLSVGGNERDYRSYVKMLEETTRKWEGEWKGFCDHVQDLEEERLDFIKDNVWVYANAVSSVCVTDDESCERIRVSLEGFETSTEMETFVKNFGTGAKIPDPPPFVDYSRGEAYSREHGFKSARFHRSSTRPPPGTNASNGEVYPQAGEYQEEEAPTPIEKPREKEREREMSLPAMNGNGNGNGNYAEPQRQQSMPRSHSPFGGVPMPGMAAVPAQRAESPAPASAAPPPQQQRYDSPAPNIRPPSAFARPSSAFGGAPAPTGPAAMRSAAAAEDEDPIARSLAQLRMDPPPAGSIRRGNSSRRPESMQSIFRPGSVQGFPAPRSPGPINSASDVGSRSSINRQSFQHASRPSLDTSLISPAAGHTAAELAKSREDHNMRASRSFASNQDFHAAASDVVGSQPPQRSHTPSGSISAGRGPSPAFMQPPVQPSSPVVDGVMSQYHQAFPGERSRGPSRSGSVSSRRSRGQSISVPIVQQQQDARAPSREGFVGIGAGTASLVRSASPQPGAQPAQSYPTPQQPNRAPTQSASQPNFTSPAPQTQSLNTRGSGYPGQAPQQAPQTASYPGINKSATAPYGQNQYGSMGQSTQSASQQFPSPAPPAAAVPQQYQGYQQPQQQYQQQYNSPVSYTPAQQPFAQSYTSASSTYGQPSHSASMYPQQAPAAAPYQQQVYQAPPQQQQQNNYARTASPAPPPVMQQAQMAPPPLAQIAREPSPAVPAVAPVDTPPTGQYSTSGDPILFFKALYDYRAESDSEFDFQSGDIIAVTHTPADGWWSGELLDEARRQHGKTDFPSNFVCLF